ncbi:metabolite-proton symporter [Inquilinus ginsengisoli]|uniref:MFS transporter n=1 Tax=Inquilinus ginsengisoli TaxID=363840 RepID=UPI003D213BB5
MTDTTFGSATPAAANSTGRIVMASLVGTAIEFYDFYIYGTAAALVFGPVFFPQESDAAQLLLSFATFAIAFVARPVGSALLGHFGDRVGRKATLVASLLLMGVSTMLIGVLPGYATIGWLAPALLCLMRFGQGLGLGGEWGGAALLAVENAPAGKRGWFGMFPQLGAPIGFLAANGLFLLLALGLDEEQFRAWGWRVPFLLSAVLVAVGLYVRLKLVETPVFREAMKRQERVRVPIGEVLTRYTRITILGTLAMVSCYALFYITTVFSLGYGTKTLGYSRQTFLGLECFAIIFLGLGIPLSSWLSDRIGRRPVLIVGGILTALFGFALAPLLGGGSMLLVTLFLCLGLFLMGLIFGPMGAFLPELFPTRVRYTGASLTYNLAGILGASLAPYIAQTLVEQGGLGWVGGYISIAAVISVVAVWLIRETHDQDLTRVGR